MSWPLLQSSFLNHPTVQPLQFCALKLNVGEDLFEKFHRNFILPLIGGSGPMFVAISKQKMQDYANIQGLQKQLGLQLLLALSLT